jgi:hypothetical protein
VSTFLALLSLADTPKTLKELARLCEKSRSTVWDTQSSQPFAFEGMVKRVLDDKKVLLLRKVQCCSHLKHLEHLSEEELRHSEAADEVTCRVSEIWVCHDCFDAVADNSYFAHYIADDSMEANTWS